MYAAARYYGTVFSIILTIILLGGVTSYIGYTCWKEIVSPPNRLNELRSFEAQLTSSVSDNKLGADEQNSEPNAFVLKVKEAFSKLTNLIHRKRQA